VISSRISQDPIPLEETGREKDTSSSPSIKIRLLACPARIYTRRLVGTNEIHETDIRVAESDGHYAVLAMQTFRRANKRENGERED